MNNGMNKASHHPSESWGQHLILDLSGCHKSFLTDGEHIKKWVKELVKKIEMVAYGEPMLEHFATHDPKTGGYTLVQLIETSNICAHFAENRGEVYIDIFSCKSFSNDVATEVCKEYFCPTNIVSHSIIRGEVREKMAAQFDILISTEKLKSVYENRLPKIYFLGSDFPPRELSEMHLTNF